MKKIFFIFSLVFALFTTHFLIAESSMGEKIGEWKEGEKEILKRKKKILKALRNKKYDIHSNKVRIFDFEDLSFNKKIRHIHKHAPKWMSEQIEQDFSPYTKDYDWKKVDQFIKKHGFDANERDAHQFAFIKIKDGKISYRDFTNNSNRLRYLLAVLNKLKSVLDLPNVSFLLTTHDGYYFEGGEVPILCFSKLKENHTAILIPDSDALLGYFKYDQEIEEANKKFTWELKKEKAFWRGSTTGANFINQDWKLAARTHLAMQSLEIPTYLDAKYSNMVQGADKNEEFMAMKNLVGEYVPYQESLNYKYLIDIDGNASTYSRYYWILLSNSVPFKIEGKWTQWYYNALKPYEHYIPVQNDKDDIKEKVLWAKNHDPLAQEISKNATRFVYDNLTHEHNCYYLYLVLQKMSQLQNENTL